jgi:hypothetical protein
MAITARCPGCGQILSVEDQYAGQQGQCPTCKTVVLFSGTANVQPAAAPPVAPAPSATAPGPSPPTETYGYTGAAPAPAGGLAALDPLMLTYAGLGTAVFFYLLLLVSTFLSWRVVGGGSVTIGDRSITSPALVMAGTAFGDGRMLLCLTLMILGVVAINFLNRRFLPEAMVLGGSFATFTFLMMLGWIAGSGAGIIIGLIASLGGAGACIWTAVRQPFVISSPLVPGGQSFFRAYGALLVAEAAALILGVFYCLLRAIFAVM